MGVTSRVSILRGVAFQGGIFLGSGIIYIEGGGRFPGVI